MSAVSPYIIPRISPYKQISSRFDSQYGALWCVLDPKPRACFTFEVLDELRRFQQEVERLAADGGEAGGRVRYVVLASRSPGVFNYGGDLALFARCVQEKDAATLRKYALACIDVLHRHAVGFRLPVTTISLVQGDALGGGFEAALASDVVIAERQVQMGFPEVMFNLFPGMGAYNLLDRRLGMLRAERMILSGKLYSAEELHAEGVVDLLAENGRGENTLYEYIVRHSGKRNAHEAVLKVRRELRPLPYEKLVSVLDVWVDAAMRIGPREIRLMERLARAQERPAPVEPLRFPPPGPRSA